MTDRPNSLGDLFITLTVLALQGFGGVLAVVQHELVVRKRWLTQEEFIEEWAVAQVLPGPNVVNLCLIVGSRYFGWRGALVALAGMLCVPTLVVLALAVLYARYGAHPVAVGALRGMAAVAAGLILAAGFRLASALKGNPLGLTLCVVLGVLSFVGVALLRLPLFAILLGPGVVGCALAYWKLGESAAMTPIVLDLTWSDWLALFGHYLALSLMAVGAAFSTLPEMHRYLVERQGWLTDPQFTASITLAQAAPGPNVLFVALMGWNVGMNAGSYGSALLGAFLTMSGMLLPSSVLVFFAARWGQRNRERRVVRAFKLGMGPVVIALLIATGWIMARAQGSSVEAWPLWLLTAVTTLIVWRTRIHLLWLLGAGALLGALGWV